MAYDCHQAVVVYVRGRAVTGEERLKIHAAVVLGKKGILFPLYLLVIALIDREVCINDRLIVAAVGLPYVSLAEVLGPPKNPRGQGIEVDNVIQVVSMRVSNDHSIQAVNLPIVLKVQERTEFLIRSIRSGSQVDYDVLVRRL